MNKQKSILLALTLAMIGGTGWFLAHLHSFQRLGKPGVKTRPLAGSKNLEVVLPEQVLDYNSEPIPLAEIVTNTLPPDTSFGQRLYTGPDGFWMQVSVVLMGGDRTSMHKPQFCLEGQGFQLGPSAYSTQVVPMKRPYPYELTVGRLIGTREVEVNGQRKAERAIYVRAVCTGTDRSGHHLTLYVSQARAVRRRIRAGLCGHAQLPAFQFSAR